MSGHSRPGPRQGSCRRGELVEVMAVGLITCGEVEDVVGALTPVGRGVAQVFHDLLVELRLLLVAEVEERGEEEDRRK